MDDFITTEELAQRARCPAGTVRYWVYTGYAPRSVKVGRRRLFATADVEAWLTALRDGDPKTAA